MFKQFSRSELLLGREGMEKLADSCVAVFGVGGVGSYVVEALARSGVGHLVLVDKDDISESNINRQLHATTKTIGQQKTEVMKNRILDINPQMKVDIINDFYLPDNAEDFFICDYDYIVDAIDTVTAKIDLVLQGDKRNIPVISSMGAGNKLNPAMFEVADIYKKSVCPLARVMRQKLKKLGIKHLKVVYSKEEPIKTGLIDEETNKSVPGSLAFVPSVAGLIIAGEVVKDLAKKN